MECNDKASAKPMGCEVTSNNILSGQSRNENTKENNQQMRHRKRPRQLLTEKIAKEKQMEIVKELKEERKKRPKNLLFTTGYSSEDSLGGTDSETET